MADTAITVWNETADDMDACVSALVAITVCETESPTVALPATLLNDTHAVKQDELPPTRKRALSLVPDPLDTATVTDVDPVVGKLVLTTLLTASDTPAKLTAALALDHVRPDVATAANPLSHAAPALARTALNDTHAVLLLLLLRPRRPPKLVSIPALRLYSATTVTLTDPVVGPLPAPDSLFISGLPELTARPRLGPTPS